MIEKPIRVAQVMGKMIGGGVESVVLNYYKAIDKSKIQFDFIVDEDSTDIPTREILEMGGRIYKVPPYENLVKYLFAMRKIFKNNNYQIVHSHINALSVFPLMMAKHSKIGIRIAHSHSMSAPGEYKKNIVKNILKIFSIKYPTNLMSPTIEAGVWLFGEKKRNDIFLLKNAVTTKKFTFESSRRTQLRGSLGIKSDDLVIGNVGRMVWQKNQEKLLDILLLLNKQVSSKLIIVGDGPLKNDLIKHAEKNNLASNLIIVDPTEKIEDYYSAMDAFVFPSRYEGLGMVAVEAQLSGLPTICSDAVPNEANISSLFRKINLNSTNTYWANKIIATVKSNTSDRLANSINITKNTNYDIEKNAPKLVDYYLNLAAAGDYK
ncbi:glycosyltransferase [Latilactobacillus sakei]|uniref:glycosyltransferase n=1 Tax=Latilactobacillus sakei TaxID=1599 RepID=UPI003CF1A8B3